MRRLRIGPRRGVQYRAGAAKVALGSLATAAPIGRAVGSVFGDKIPHHGVRVDARGFADPVKAAMFFGLYESSETRFVRRHMGKHREPVVVELGSSLGVVSSHIVSLLPPRGRLITVEANPWLIPALRARFRDLRGGKSVDVVHAAISYQESTSTITFGVSDDCRASRVEANTPGGVAVPRSTLRDVLERHSVRSDYFLVADIEGAEADILMEDTQSLRTCRAAVLELHETPRADVGELVRRLEAEGFELRGAHGPVVHVARSVRS